MAWVVIDEKWFFKEKVNRKVIVSKGQKKPHRSVRHKSHIEKVMFLSAQARPRHDPTRKAVWDGKIAFIPIGEYTQAQKNSVHYNRGDVKWENRNVDTETYLELMEQVVRSIAAKWPRGQWGDARFKIKIQHDGAPAHTSGAFKRSWDMMLAQLFVDGVLPTADKIELYTQPPNSPDTNINDLGLFNALQSRYERLSPKNSIEMIQCVLKVWKEYPYQRINPLFLTLQLVFNEIIEHHGGNDFKLPHMSKFKLERLNKLPVSIKVHPNVWAYLLAMDDPDYPEGDEFVDDDLPLPGTISRVELAELLEDVSDEE